MANKNAASNANLCSLNKLDPKKYTAIIDETPNATGKIRSQISDLPNINQ